MNNGNDKYPYDDNQENQADNIQSQSDRHNLDQDQQANDHRRDYNEHNQMPPQGYEHPYPESSGNEDQYNHLKESYVNQQEDHQNPNGLNAHKKTKKARTKKQKSGGGGNFFSAVLGGLISAVLIVGLLFSGILPVENFTGDGDSGNDTQQATTSNHSSNEATQPVSVDNADESSDVDEVSQAVVGIKNMQKQDMWDPGEEAGSGSGIIYKKEDGKAYIVTNNHVVDNAKEVEVVLSDDEQVKANVLGKDDLTDLAVLEIDDDKVDVVAKLGSSSDLNVGQTVLAIGNPLGQEFYGSITRGIVSGLDRSIEVDTNGDQQPDWITEVIQTDAAINPGNSGGALVNSDGEVIGINSMKVARDAVEGIGFAIPIDSAVPIIEQLESEGEITRPYIGISTASIEQVPMEYRDHIKLPDDIDKGMVVANVETGSPADQAGLEQFDVITKINGEDIASTLDLRKYLYKETEIGDNVKVEFYHEGDKQETDLKLAEREN